jgi:hypothetical protein
VQRRDKKQNKMKKIVLIVLLNFSSISIFCQDVKKVFDGNKWQAPYSLAIPTQWGTERIPFPLEFAPTIPYKGILDLRFSPGWNNAKSDEYWSYAFLWYLDGKPKTTSKILKENLTNYFRGLTASEEVKGKDTITVFNKVTVNIEQIKTFKGDNKTFSGNIDMINFLDKKPILLNCIIHLKTSPEENKTYLFYELSPKQFEHKTWELLHKLWIDFRFKSNNSDK